MKHFVLIACDCVGFLIAFALALYFSDWLNSSSDLLSFSSPVNYFSQYWIVVLLAGAGFLDCARHGHYGARAPWWQQVKQVLVFCAVAFVIHGFVNYAFNAPTHYFYTTLVWVFSVPLILMLRRIARLILLNMGLWVKSTYLVGGTENAIETLFALKSENYLDYEIKGVILPDASPQQIKHFKALHEGYEIQKTYPEFGAQDFVILCPDNRRDLELTAIVEDLIQAQVRYAVVPPLEGFSMYGLKPDYFFGYHVVFLQPYRTIKTAAGSLAKEALDKVGALTALIIFSPLFFFIVRKIKADGGPAFYSQERIGKNGKTFKCWKFRSMVTNSQEVLEELLANDPEAKAEWDRDFKLKDDPRITKIGHFIRKTSLDEIPQVFNVLRGEMSLVGPRPIIEDERKYYGDAMADYEAVKPGITGLWQVSGRNDITYEQRVYLDRWYVRNWSVWNDIVILIKTVFVVLGRRGAY